MAHDLLSELLDVDALEIALLLLDEVGGAIEGNTAVVADDAAAAVSIGQTSDDVCVAGGLDVVVVSREHTLVMCLAILREDCLGGGVELIAVGLESLLHHAYASLGEDASLQGCVGLQTHHHFAVLVDIASTVGIEALGKLGLSVVHALLALHLKEVGEDAPELLCLLGGAGKETLVAVVGLVVGLNKISYVNLALPIGTFEIFLEVL